jgi:hypothetical protein
MQNRIEELWRQHEAAPFPPECRGEEISGIDLVMLDADTAGCISTFLGCAGRLDSQRRTILSQCRSELEAAVQTLEGESANYFRRLSEIAQLVLEATSVKPRP